MKKIGLIVVLLIVVGGVLFLSTGRGEALGGKAQEAETPSKKELFAMDTQMSVTAYGKNGQAATEKAIGEIKKLDEEFATNNVKGQIYKVNQEGKGTVEGATKEVIGKAIDLYSDTEGAFDITVFPLVEKWGFISKDYAVPKEEELKELLTLVGSDKIALDKKNGDLSFRREGMKIDLGGIAKGYTSNRIIEIMKEEGITSGIVSLGGNVQTLGNKPDGEPWKIGIRNPDPEKEVLGVVKVKDKAVITSGGYERFFVQEGKTYHHILEPKTGKPAENELVSVTIISEDGMLADGLSTALFVKVQRNIGKNMERILT
ncbi:MAG: FAD:protein FMN transferase [Anaerovoracaceae bacterium]